MKKTSIRDDHIATHSPSRLSKKIREALIAKGTNVSLMTASRLSNEFGLNSHIPTHKHCLTTAMKFKCLVLAKKYYNWKAEQWGKVLFVDESPVQQCVVCTQNVRRPPGTRYTIPTTRHPPS